MYVEDKNFTYNPPPGVPLTKLQPICGERCGLTRPDKLGREPDRPILLVLALLFECLLVPGFLNYEQQNAKVAELVDALDLGSCALRCGGSTPPFRTILI